MECPIDYEVYGGDADWEKDTIKSLTPNATYRDLLRNAKLVNLYI